MNTNHSFHWTADVYFVFLCVYLNSLVKEIGAHCSITIEDHLKHCALVRLLEYNLYEFLCV